MTISTTISSVTLQGNAATTTWPFPFLIPQASDLIVILTDNTVSPAIETTLDPSLYSASGFGNALGGDVTYPLSGPPLAAGIAITIERILPLTQSTDITDQSAFYPSVVEGEFDYLTMITQQLQAALNRAMVVPVGTGQDPAVILAQILDAAAIIAALSAGVPPVTAANFAALRAINPAGLTFAVLLGSVSAGDGGGGIFIYNSGSSAADDGGSIAKPASVSGAGRWLRLFTDELNVIMFGAYGLGADETAQLQACLDSAYTQNLSVRFNAGNYLTDTLTYKGQKLIGAGSGILAGGNTTTITGKPGKDILQAVDPSLNPSGGVDLSLKGFSISGIHFLVDRASAGSFTRPMWPIHSAWSAGLAVQTDMLVTNGGNIYGARNTGTTGATPPTHTSGVASDGTINWIFLSAAQTNVANAAIAFPLHDNSIDPGYYTFIYRPEMRDVVIDQINAGSTNSCGLFTQRGMYGWLGGNVLFRSNPIGLCITQSNIFDTGVPSRGSSGCELFDLDSVEFLNSTCFVQNGQNLIGKNFRFYNQAGGRQLLLLPLVYDQTPVRTVGSTHKFHAMYVENGQSATTVQAFYVDGIEHMFDFNQSSFGPDSFVGWAASRSEVFGLSYSNFDHNGSLAASGMRLFGDRNKFKFNNSNFVTTPPINSGNGNSYEVISTAGVPYLGQRPYQLVARARATAAMQDGAFGALSLVSTPFDSINDLMVDAREFSWIDQVTSTPVGFTYLNDATLESGGYLHVTTANGVVANGYFGSGNRGFTIGRTWPAAPVIVRMKLRAGTAGTQRIVFQIKNSSGTIVGSNTQDVSLTTGWAIYSFALDLSTFNTDTINIGINTPHGSGAAAYCDMAWVMPTLIPEIVPLRSYTVAQVATLPATFPSMIYVSDETGGAVPAFADGTNWRRVTDRAIVS